MVRSALPAKRVLLIGGTSNVGKSTVARSLAAAAGFECQSTDTLARHPGRPWRTAGREVPPHVVEHYAKLSRADLLRSVLGHYDRLWPTVEALIRWRVADPDLPRLVLEGSALWPPRVAPVISRHVAAVWLYADDQVIERRMHEAAGYDELSPADRHLVDQFFARTQDYQHRMLRSVDELGLAKIDTSASTVTAIVGQILAAANGAR